MTHAPDPRAAGPGRRIEPTLNDGPLPVRPPPRIQTRVPPVPTWRSRRVWRWAAIAVVLLTVSIIVFRRPLADALWPDTRLQQLLDQADAALVAGRLDRADGSGARQLFEAAQALDTDRNEANAGLQRVGQAALRQASAALEQNRFDDARSLLALARELQVPRAPADAVAARLRAREIEHAGIEGFVQAAREAQASGHLIGGDGAALPLYQRVLALQPAHLLALEGREDALSDVLAEAGRQLDAGALEAAASLIAQARAFDDGHVDLPQAQAALARAVDVKRESAARHLRRGRLVQSAGAYESVLAVAPDDARALQGLEQVGIAHARAARQYAADFDFTRARAELERARALAPRSPLIADAEQSLQRGQQAQSRLPAALPSAERSRRVRALLDQMQQAEAQGSWLTPPGESAYDALRAAQAIAPEHAAVKRAAARLLPSIRGCFEDELRANRIRRAQACLQAWQTLQPGDAALRDARRQLAEKWIAVGDERLGAGEVAFAAQALSEARALDDAAPGLQVFSERVRTAQAASTYRP